MNNSQKIFPRNSEQCEGFVHPPDNGLDAVVGEGGHRLVVFPIRILTGDSLAELLRHHLSVANIEL